jgi:hypothetical protein
MDKTKSLPKIIAGSFITRNSSKIPALLKSYRQQHGFP